MIQLRAGCQQTYRTRRKRQKQCLSLAGCCSEHGALSPRASEPRIYGKCKILESCFPGYARNSNFGTASEDALREIVEAHIRVNLLVSEAQGAEAAAVAAEQVS